jgi:post-segregation antitoxin (ccd killing protein)
MEIYTEVITLKISKVQKQTLDKLRNRKVKVSHFVRQAIKEKIDRDALELIDKSKVEYCPFSNGTIILRQ